MSEDRAADPLVTKPPHPMPGWMVLMDIPLTREEDVLHPLPQEMIEADMPDKVRELLSRFGVENADEALEKGKVSMHGFAMEPGISAGLVIELGEVDPMWREMSLINEGSKVYYPNDRFLSISEYRLVQWQSVIAYENE